MLSVYIPQLLRGTLFLRLCDISTWTPPTSPNTQTHIIRPLLLPVWQDTEHHSPLSFSLASHTVLSGFMVFVYVQVLVSVRLTAFTVAEFGFSFSQAQGIYFSWIWIPCAWIGFLECHRLLWGGWKNWITFTISVHRGNNLFVYSGVGWEDFERDLSCPYVSSVLWAWVCEFSRFYRIMIFFFFSEIKNWTVIFNQAVNPKETCAGKAAAPLAPYCCC